MNITNAIAVRLTIVMHPYGETASHGAGITRQNLKHTEAESVSDKSTNKQLTIMVLGL